MNLTAFASSNEVIFVKVPQGVPPSLWSTHLSVADYPTKESNIPNMSWHKGDTEACIRVIPSIKSAFMKWIPEMYGDFQPHHHWFHKIPCAPKTLQNLETVWKAVDVQPLIKVMPQEQFFQAACAVKKSKKRSLTSPRDPKKEVERCEFRSWSGKLGQ